MLPAIERILKSERCFIAIRDARGILVPRASSHITLGEDPATWPVSRRIIQRVLGEGIAILSADALVEHDLAASAMIQSEHIRAIFAVPLGPKDECTGLIYADHTFQADVFGESDLVFLTALGHFIHIALANARALTREAARRRVSDERWTLLQEESLKDHEIVGGSLSLLEAYDRLRRVAAKPLPVLLLGETGTGKDRFAHALHRVSPRAERPFVPVNVAALSDSLVESELFGHEKGAFTGALGRKLGRLELADGGTLFLDELTEIPLHVQATLLRALESGEFERVGGTETVSTDVRIVCATNRDLEAAVRDGTFREDLYYRLRGVEIRIPPLRARMGDVAELAEHFLRKLDSRKWFDGAALECLEAYSWPGNVRQLLRLVEEMDAVCEGDEIRAEDLPAHIRGNASGLAARGGLKPLNDAIAEFERGYIEHALRLTNGHNSRAIELLGISRERFFKRKKAYGL